MSRWISPGLWILFVMRVVVVCFTAESSIAYYDGPSVTEFHDPSGADREIPGLSFRVFVDRGMKELVGGGLDEAEANALLFRRWSAPSPI